MTNPRPDPWPWSETMDGPLAAPDHHRVIFENDRVRVLEVVIRAGDTAPLHTHGAPTVSYVLSGSSFIRRNEHGTVVVDTLKLDPPFVMPPVVWSDFIGAHTLQNPGPEDLRLIAVELKD